MKKQHMKNDDGFTLIELIMVIVLLGVLSAVAVPKFNDYISVSRIQATKSEMMILKESIAGQYGYKSTVGSDVYQFNLQYLIELPPGASGVTAYSIVSGAGWNGPYVSDNGDGEFKNDAWGNIYILTASSITSYGPNGTTGGGDDIVITY